MCQLALHLEAGGLEAEQHCCNGVADAHASWRMGPQHNVPGRVAAVLAVVPEIVLVSLGSGSVAWKPFYLLRMLRLLRINRLARAVWGAALSCGPGTGPASSRCSAALTLLCRWWASGPGCSCTGNGTRMLCI